MRALLAASFAAVLASSLTACVDDPGAIDDAGDAALADGKADGQLSACEADQLLAYVNGGVSAQAMIDAGVHARAARNIVEHRVEDGGYATLAELDAVPYVGPIAFGQLQAIVGPRCELVTLQGQCTVTTTPFAGGYGTPSTESAPIVLPVRVDGPLPASTEPQPITGTVVIASPWGDVPSTLWRAWCNRTAGFDDLSRPCSIGGLELATRTLGIGSASQSSFTFSSAEGYAMFFTAFLEVGRDTYYDPNFTSVRFSCQLR